MKKRRRPIGPGPGRPPQQQRHHQQVEQQARVAHQPGQPGLGEQRPHQPPVAFVPQPHGERAGGQPVGVELGQAREEIYQPQLAQQQVARPGRDGGGGRHAAGAHVERGRPVSRQHRQQSRHQAKKVMVVDVRGGVEQKQPPAAQAQQQGRGPVVPAGRHGQSAAYHHGVESVYSRSRQVGKGRQQVGKMVARLQVALRMAQHHRARVLSGDEHARAQPEKYQPGNVNGLKKSIAQARRRG